MRPPFGIYDLPAQEVARHENLIDAGMPARHRRNGPYARTREAGFKHHLVKPVDFADLKRVLARPD
jgi:hypothetical protein